MKKEILSFITFSALFMFPLCIHAEEVETYTDISYLYIDAENTTFKFVLTDNPLITFDSGNLIITSDKDTISTALSEIKDYRIESNKVSTSIRSIKDETVNKNQPDISCTNTEITHLKAGAQVTIYNINGVQVSSVAADCEGKAILHLTQLPQGVYILHAGNKSFKIINK